MAKARVARQLILYNFNMARYMTDKEREALEEFENELLDSLKELRKRLKKVAKKVDSH